MGEEEEEQGEEEDRRVSMVSVTKAAIWGHTRGCLEEQRITPMEGPGGGVVGDDMASVVEMWEEDESERASLRV